MKSALYRGRVKHDRLVPRRHVFSKRINFCYLDLDELESVFAKRWLWSTTGFGLVRFKRSDYLGSAEQPLREAVLDRVEQEVGRRPSGALGILTQLRTFGYLFNPVSFYYCHDEHGELDAIVAEITNTPWGERHAYVLDAQQARARGDSNESFRFRFDKAFHVSPFFDLDQVYEWRFSAPGEHAEVAMTNLERGQTVFHVGLSCRRLPITGWNLATSLLLFPLQPLRLHAAIYWHAALLYLKRTPFFTHPTKRQPAPEGPSS